MSAIISQSRDKLAEKLSSAEARPSCIATAKKMAEQVGIPVLGSGCYGVVFPIPEQGDAVLKVGNVEYDAFSITPIGSTTRA